MRIKEKQKIFFKQKRKRVNDIIGVQKKNGKATYAEVVQRQEQNVGKTTTNASYASYSEEEEERRLIKELRKKKDKEHRDKRMQEYNEYRRNINVREDKILGGKRGIAIEYQRNREEDLTREIKEDRNDISEDIEKRVRKMEEMIIRI